MGEFIGSAAALGLLLFIVYISALLASRAYFNSKLDYQKRFMKSLNEGDKDGKQVKE
jgi:hypothetical protein